AVPHPNLAATYEVQEISGRPAALQEWVSGLTSPDWPALAAAPGVWYRLLGQTALGLQAAHHASLTHGRLTGQSGVLTAEGVGEGGGLHSAADPAAGVRADVEAWGRLACEWSMRGPRRKSSRAKPLPEGLQTIVRGLGAASFNGWDASDEPILVPPFPPADR